MSEIHRILEVKWDISQDHLSYYNLQLHEDQWKRLEEVLDDMDEVTYNYDFVQSLPNPPAYRDINQDLVFNFFGLDINYCNPQ